ncbi:MAG: FtsX-like permease family protein [Mogibacterium sp.]|nr:FtsX-like permease family protein [Mogibacterium sp.]
MLRKSTLREIRTSLARYLAIFAIVALGVGFFAGLKDCKASMVSTANTYLQEHNFYDYMILSSYGIDDESVRMALAEDGVTAAEGSIQIDALVDTGAEGEQALKAISLPDNINLLNVVDGRLPERPDECVVDHYTLTGDSFQIGGTLTVTDSNDEDTLDSFAVRKFTIVGSVNTPIYLDYQRGSTTLGDGSLDTFFFVPKEAFDTDYYTQLYLRLEEDQEILSDALNDKLDRYEDPMDDLAERITADRREREQGKAQKELDEKKEEYEENLAKYRREKADAEKKLNNAQKQITDGKKELAAARKKANATIKDLKEKRKQVEDGIKQAEAGKAQLEQALADSAEQKAQIEAGLSQLEAGKAQLEAGIAQAQDGLAQLEQGEAQLEQAYAAGMLTEEQYQGQRAVIDEQRQELNGTIAALQSQLTEVESQIKEAKAGLAQITAAEKQLAEVKATIKSLKKNRDQIDDGLKQAEDGLKTISQKENELAKAQRTLNNKRKDANREFADAEKELADAKEKIDDAQEEIDEMEMGNSYALSRNDNAGYSSFDSNSDIVSTIAKIFPVFFFLIAALVCMTTMTRMVDEQRTQIGVLKALGYSNGAILAKYMFYSGSAAFLGAVTGFFIGCKVFPLVIWRAYTMMYDFNPDVDYIIDWKLGLISLAVAMVCSAGATWASVANDFKVPPSDLIRPKAPKAGKRILLERITPIWNRVSFLYKVSIRNIFRDKKRFFMMVIGVSGCTALLIAGMGIGTTISNIADYQFDEISIYDYQVIFSKNMTEARQKDFLDYMEKEAPGSEVAFVHQGAVDLTYNGKTFEVTCIAADPEGFSDYIDLHANGQAIPFPAEGEVVVVRKLAHDYGIQAGDTLVLRDGYREMTVKVAAINENYVSDNIFMSYDTYRNGFGKKVEIKSALVCAPEGSDEASVRDMATTASNYDDTAAVSVNLDVRDRITKMMKSLNAVIYVVILSAGLLAFIVLYNLTNINITERVREIATIKVLGFYPLEVSQYVFRENLFLTAIAAVVGIPMGRWLLRFVIDNIVVKFIFFEARLDRMDYVWAIILTFVFSFVVNLVMQRRLDNVSMTESLKSVE